jgi:acylphosphatase
MGKDKKILRAEIVASGLVQGVGFRYYVLRNAKNLELTGFVKNLYNGDVLTIAEGERWKIEELFRLIKIGPISAHVRKATISWEEATGEFKDFEVRY